MYDKELTLEILEQVRTASQTILDRFKTVKTVSDLIDSPDIVTKAFKAVTGAYLKILDLYFDIVPAWQGGYGVVSFGEKQLQWVVGYVNTQKQHHAELTAVARLEEINVDSDGPAPTVIWSL